MLTSAKRELQKLAVEYGESEPGDFTIEQLEAEVEFWLSAEQCEICDSQMCSYHYGWLVGR